MYKMRDLYPDIAGTDTTEATVPELEERESYYESGAQNAPETAQKAPRIWLAVGGLAVFLFLVSFLSRAAD